MAGKALVLPMMDVDPEMEPAFNEWYNERYIPAVLEVPGFLNARRFRAIEGQPKYLAAWDIEDLSVLRSEAYTSRSAWGPTADPRDAAMYNSFRGLIRGVYEHLVTLPEPEPADLSAARALLVMGLEVAPQHEDEFNDWYDTEHLPALVQIPGVLRARRFRVAEGLPGPQADATRYVALYDLTDPSVQASDEWRQRRSSPWSDRMGRLFTRFRRNVYERIWPA